MPAKLSDLKTNENIKLMVYGPSGVGKTVFATTFPGPIYVADFDGKVSSAASYWNNKDPKVLEHIVYDSFLPTAESPGTQLKAFDQVLAKQHELIKQGKFPFKTYVIDSLTLFAEALMQYGIKENPGIKRFEGNVPVLQDYLIFGVHFKQYLAKILALPCNVVVIAHADYEKDESTGAITIRPLLSGKLSNEIPIRFSEVYLARLIEKDGKTHHALQTRSTGKEICRTQIPGIPQIIQANFQAINDAIHGSVATKQS